VSYTQACLSNASCGCGQSSEVACLLRFSTLEFCARHCNCKLQLCKPFDCGVKLNRVNCLDMGILSLSLLPLCVMSVSWGPMEGPQTSESKQLYRQTRNSTRISLDSQCVARTAAQHGPPRPSDGSVLTTPQQRFSCCRQLLGMSSDEGLIDLTDGIPPYKRQRLNAGD